MRQVSRQNGLNMEVDIQVHISDETGTVAIGDTVIYRSGGDKQYAIDDMVAQILLNFVYDRFDIEVIEGE